MRRALTVGVRRKAEYVLVKVEGEVDIATVPRLRECLWAVAAGGRPLVADLDQVTFIDAAGLGALAGAATRATAHGSRLYVVCTRRQMRRLFHLTGLDQRIPLTSTLAEALRELEAGPEGSASAPGPGNLTAGTQPQPS